MVGLEFVFDLSSATSNMSLSYGFIELAVQYLQPLPSGTTEWAVPPF